MTVTDSERELALSQARETWRQIEADWYRTATEVTPQMAVHVFGESLLTHGDLVDLEAALVKEGHDILSEK